MRLGAFVLSSLSLLLNFEVARISRECRCEMISYNRFHPLSVVFLFPGRRLVLLSSSEFLDLLPSNCHGLWDTLFKDRMSAKFHEERSDWYRIVALSPLSCSDSTRLQRLTSQCQSHDHTALFVGEDGKAPVSQNLLPESTVTRLGQPLNQHLC